MKILTKTLQISFIILASCHLVQAKEHTHIESSNSLESGVKILSKQEFKKNIENSMLKKEYWTYKNNDKCITKIKNSKNIDKLIKNHNIVFNFCSKQTK